MKVQNYDYTSDNLLTSAAGYIAEAGSCGEYMTEATSILGLEYDDDDDDVWADIYFSTSDGKQYAVCADGDATSTSTKFYYKELEYDEYVHSDKYNDEFWNKAEQEVEWCDDEDITIVDAEDGRELADDEKDNADEICGHNYEITYKGQDPAVIDDTDNVESSDDAFNGFARACDDVKICAYLAGLRHMYDTGDNRYYFV